ncbi:MAG: lipid A phosphoethanolamine transferase [Firmicutes bacterium]|nr:lipid A phosphoethanolamine transferase [Bacillota bacterium]MCM1401199.1 lipid A phosphoethanolamine transferase [Bacteroides sp.]MCM1477104.1 lipid A phosphoethanolamine transferase [Bacteroides sp.]
MKHSKQIYSQTGLAVILFFWVLIASVAPNVWLSLVEPLSPVQALANVLLPTGVYILSMSISRHIGRTALWMTFVMFFAAFQLVLLYMYGRSVIAVDMFLNLVTTNPGEVGELLGNLFPIIAAVVVGYLFPIIGAIVAVVKKWRLTEKFQRIMRMSGYWLTGAGTVCFVAGFFSSNPYNPLTDLFPVNVLYNAGVAIDRTDRLADYPRTSADYTFEAVSTRPDSIAEVYVAVIGETSRAENWQLAGYERPTTPALMNKDGLVYFPKTLSQSNTTHKSVPMLMSALDASAFGDSIYHVKSFITAFKEAGFHTAFFSNQNRNHSFIDLFGSEADTCVFIREDVTNSTTTHYYDKDLLKYLDRELAKGHKKQLIVLHTYGSHFSYMDRYPKEEEHFKPATPADAAPAYRDELVNAYNNTILYTSNFLNDVIGRLAGSGAQSALIYTSDHGEDIYDDSRRLFLHASPCPSYYQIHVPFLVWMSSGFRNNHPEIFTAALSNSDKFVASSQAYFHTLLDIAGLKSSQFNSSASVASPAYAPGPVRYLNDHNREVTLEEAGLLEPDFAKLRDHSIRSWL